MKVENLLEQLPTFEIVELSVTGHRVFEYYGIHNFHSLPLSVD